MKTSDFDFWVLNYLLNSFWQVPMIFLAAWAAARLARSAGPRMEHRIWVTALTFEAILPACHLGLADLYTFAWKVGEALLSGGSASGGRAQILLGPSVTSRAGALHLPAPLIGFLLGAYVISLLYFAARLAWGFSKTSQMLRQAETLALAGELPGSRLRLSPIVGREFVRAEFALSPMISGPVTVGVRRQVLLMPPGLPRERCRRRPRCPPGPRVRAHAAAEAIAGRESYARSLLRLASLLSDAPPAMAHQAIGIFDANNLERRIMMLTRKQIEIRGKGRLAIFIATGILALATCASALALHMEVTGAATASAAPAQLKVKASSLKILHKKPPVYPAKAKASGHTVNGDVVLEVLIGKTGVPEHIKVVKSLRNDYDLNAIDAVSKWRWEPYHLNGNPIKVDTQVTIVYKEQP